MDLVDESLDAALRRASVRRLRTLVAVASCAMAIFVGVVVMAVGSSRNEKAGASTVDGSVLVPLSVDELAASDSEMWDQLSSGWVAYGSYDAETLAPVRGWVHLKGTPESVDFDLVQSQNETNFGGLPVVRSAFGRAGIRSNCGPAPKIRLRPTCRRCGGGSAMHGERDRSRERKGRRIARRRHELISATQPDAGHIGSLSADVDRHQPDRR